MNLHRSREAVPSTPRANYLIIKTEKFLPPLKEEKEISSAKMKSCFKKKKTNKKYAFAACFIILPSNAE